MVTFGGKLADDEPAKTFDGCRNCKASGARLNLAAYGGVIQPVRSLLMAPGIMLLAASTALCKDWPTYKQLHRFMMIMSAGLTTLLALIVFTPLFYFVAQDILGTAEELLQIARWGLMISLPVGWGIAYRRFQQGVMIRNGYSKEIMAGTVIRLTFFALVMGIGYLIQTIPGTVVEASQWWWGCGLRRLLRVSGSSLC